MSHRFKAILATIALVGALYGGVGIAGQASAATSSTDLRVLLVGAGSSDPTTAAWAATLANEGVAYTEVDTGGSYGAETIALPALTDPSDATHGLFNAVIIASTPDAFAAGQLTALFDYESTFNVRQIDADAYPAGNQGLVWVGMSSTDPSNLAGVSGTTATLTTAGLAAFPSLKGPVPIDTGTYGYPATVVSPLPAGATETPLLDDAAGNVLMGVYQHPTAAQDPSDPQAGVSELTIGFDYNSSQLQWLILGPALIDWVTGGTHLGLYRNYIGQDVDDVFISDNQWSTQYQCTPGAEDPSDYTCPAGVANNPADTPLDVQMSAADVAGVAAWEKANGFDLELAFNGIGACTAPTPSAADCTGSTTVNGTTYTDPGFAADSTYPDDAAFVNALLADQSDFDWITHTWSHAFLGCTVWIPQPTSGITTDATAGTLAPGTYYYEVTAATAYGESEPSIPLSIVVGTTGEVTVSWPDATNGSGAAGNGPTLATLESEFSGGTGFWGYNIYRSTSSAGPFGLVGQVPENGSQPTYSFTDTGTTAPGDEPSSNDSFPTATDPGIDCSSATGSWFPVSSGAATPSADSSIDAEIGLDDAFAANNGLTNFTPSAIVTGEHSGLESPNIGAAFADMGITTFAADGSRQPASYTINGIDSSVTPALSTTANSAPRYPSNIYYNAPTWVDEINEYNTLYASTGTTIAAGETGHCAGNTSSTTCITTPATEASILASESHIELTHMLDNNPRVGYAHQTNLIGAGTTDAGSPSGTDSTLLDLLSDILGQYNSWYTAAAPFVVTTDAAQPNSTSQSTVIAEQAAWAKAQAAGTVSATESGGQITVTNNGTSPVTVPITAPSGSTVNGTAFGTPYGGTLSGWETLGAGASTTIATPSVVPTLTQVSPTAGTTTTGSAFTDQLNVTGNNGTVVYTQTTGSPSLSVSTTGAVSAPATLVAGPYTATGTDVDALGVTGTWTYTVTVSATTLTQVSPTAGTTTTGSAFTDQLNVTGKNGTIVYTQTTGSPSLSVSTTGAVSAPATLVAGPYTATGTDVDALGDTGTWSYTLTVNATALTQSGDTSASIPTGSPLADQLSVTGNIGAVVYTQTTGSPSLSVSTTGAVSAPATLVAGPYAATGTDVDALGDTGTWSYTLTVNDSTLTQVSPTAGTTTTGSAFADQLSVTGNNGAVVYTQTTGSPSLSVSTTGAVSAPATLVAGPYAATGTDVDALGDTGTWSYTLTVNATALTQASPTSGTTTSGKAISGQLTVTGSHGTVSYTETAGSPSLAVSATGAVTDLATLGTGTYTATGTVSDTYGDTGTWAFTLTVGAGAITQGSPTSGTTTAGKAFTTKLAVSGSHGTVSYSQTTGSLSLTVSTTGAVSAPATLVAGTYTATGTVKDTSGDTGTWTFTLTVTAGTLTQANPKTASIATDAGYSHQLAANGSHGTVSYTQSTGSPSLTVSTTGAVSAPATLVAGTYTATGTVGDTFGDTGTWTFTLTVKVGKIAQGAPKTASIATDAGYSHQLAANGSHGTVSYTQSTGSPSLTVSTTGAVSAPATLVAGTYTATGTVGDTFGDTGTWTFTLTVKVGKIAQGAPKTASTTKGTAYSGQLTSSGSHGTIVYANVVSSPGLTVSSTGAVSAPATLGAGSYVATGTDSDTFGDAGTWTFTLTVKT